MKSLKCVRQVDESELERIETPTYAVGWIKRNINANHYNVDEIRGLRHLFGCDPDLRREQWGPYAYEILLRKVADGKVVLLTSLGCKPDHPLVQNENGNWIVDSLLPLIPFDNARNLVREVLENRGILFPRYSPEKCQPEPPKPVRALAVTNPRWRHKDEKVGEERPHVALEGDTVILEVDVNKVGNGRAVKFSVFDHSASTTEAIGTAAGKVFNGVGTAEWVVKDPRANKSKGGELKLKFDGTVDRTSSERADLPVHVEGMVSFIPLVFTTPTLVRDKVMPLQEGTFLYVFRNGKLYREVTVHGEKKDNNIQLKLKTVRLDAYCKQFRGKLPEKRSATCEGEDLVRVPYMSGGKEQTIEVAVSPVQWSARYIAALEKDEAMRGKRTQKLDFKGVDSNFKGSKNLLGVEETKLAEQIKVNGIAISNDSVNRHKGKGTGVAVAYLQEPVGLALLQADRTHNTWKLLVEKIEEAKQDPYYDSAVLAYQLFFNEEVQSKSRRNQKFGGAAETAFTLNPVMAGLNATDYMAKQAGLRSTTTAESVGQGVSAMFDAGNAQIQAMKATDLGKLEDALKVKDRQRLRRQIRGLKKAQVDWLERREAQDFIPFNIAIRDYFTLAAGNYAKAFQVMRAIVEHFPNDPADLDATLTLPKDQELQRGVDNPGYRYMQELLDEKHPLHAMCFPSEKQIPVTSDAQADPTIVQNDGSGKFRPHALDMSGFSGATGVGLAELEEAEFPAGASGSFIATDKGQSYRRFAEFSAGAMAAWVTTYTKHWQDWQRAHVDAMSAHNDARAEEAGAKAKLEAAKADAFAKSKSTTHMAVLTRGLKASNLGAMGELRLANLKDVPAGHVVIGLDVLGDTGPLSVKEVKAATKEYYADPKADRGTATLLGPDGKQIGAEDPEKLGLRGKGKKRTGKTNVHKWDVEVVTLPRDVAAALGIEYFDVHHHVSVELGHAPGNAGNGTGNATIDAIRHAQQEHLNQQQNLKIKQDELASIESQRAAAREARATGAKWGQLEKGSKVLAAAFNLWNTIAAYEAWKANAEKGLKSKEFQDYIGGMVDLAYAIGEAVESLFKHVREVKAFFEWKLGRFNMFRTFGAGGAAFSTYQAVMAGIQEYKSGDSDAAFAQGVMAAGFALATAQLLAAAVATAGSTGIVAALATGPAGWIALAIILGGALLYMLFNDSDIERWAKNGPFAKGDSRDPDFAWLARGAMKDSTGKDDGFPAFEYLMGMLFKPTLSIKHPVNERAIMEPNPSFIAQVGLPALLPDAEVEIHAEVERFEDRYDKPEDRYNDYARLKRVTLPCQVMKYNKQEPGADEDGLRTLDYHYTGLPDPFHRTRDGYPDKPASAENQTLAQVKFRYRLKARVKAGNNGMVFPIIKRDASGNRLQPHKDHQETPGCDINENAPGWVYAITDLVAHSRGANWLQTKSDIVPEAK